MSESSFEVWVCNLCICIDGCKYSMIEEPRTGSEKVEHLPKAPKGPMRKYPYISLCVFQGVQWRRTCRVADKRKVFA